MAACGETQAENGACLVGGGWCLSPEDAAQATSEVVVSPYSGWKRRQSLSRGCTHHVPPVSFATPLHRALP